MSGEESDLDPRIQIELENLNSATDEINKLEIELEEANSTFRILLNESTRRLKLSSKKLGSCIEKARPYYEALEKAREAQIECQKAAVKFQRANEIHIAAKETVALAEQRFMSNSHEWQFDNAWQEMLNHLTQKVMDAEKQKADCHAEHQRRTRIFNATEQKVQQLEERFRRSIAKSRPYFEEKQICQDQLQTQKNRIQELQMQVQSAKTTYATALRNLERISDDIHRQRGDYPTLGAPPPGPREPGVGAELNSPITTELPPLPDFRFELEKCDYGSIASSQASLGGSSYRSNDLASSSGMSLPNTNNNDDDDFELECEADYAENGELKDLVQEKDLEALRQRVRILAVRPIEGGDGQQEQNDLWEHELNATVDKLDHLLLMKECAKKQDELLQQQQQHQQQQHQQQMQKLKRQQQTAIRPESLGAESNDASEAKLSSTNIFKSNNINDSDDDNDVVLVTPKSHLHAPIIKVTTSNAAGAVSVSAVSAVSAAAAVVSAADIASLPNTPEHVVQPIKKLQKLAPLPSVNVSMRELPLLARLSNDLLLSAAMGTRNLMGNKPQRRRSLE